MPHVLLVDDDRECLLALSNRLRFAFCSLGLKVDIADGAVTGLILAHEGHYEAMVADVLMPGINGLKFVEQLRRTQPSVPIIMMTGGDVNVCEEQAERLGLMACLSKPIDFAQLRVLLEEVLKDEGQLVREHRRGGRRRPQRLLTLSGKRRSERQIKIVRGESPSLS
jgi:DNA-binding NtrC family response regulator